MMNAWEDWKKYVKQTRLADKKTLNDFLKKNLGKPVTYDDFVALDTYGTIIAAAPGEERVKDLATLLNVSTPRVQDSLDFADDNGSTRGLCIGFNVRSGKVICDKKYYASVLKTDIIPY
jgi:hypothetical protein